LYIAQHIRPERGNWGLDTYGKPAIIEAAKQVTRTGP